MKYLLALTLAAAALPCSAADRIHNYCFHLAETTRRVVLAYDAGMPRAALSRRNLDAEGLSGGDLYAVITSVYSGQLDDAPMPDILLSTYAWCLKAHAADMGQMP